MPWKTFRKVQTCRRSLIYWTF